ncbi:MAG: chemotaxis protein CheW [Mariprofundaceae bacterium]|nr:chemotaxis protein CheW [Mariprofundaceae bacterium]
MNEQTTPSPAQRDEDAAAHAAMQQAVLEQVDYEEIMLIHIGEHRYLLRVKEAEEVVKYQNLTAVPMAPNHLLGVCNVHGLVVCIVDPVKVLNLKGAMQPRGGETRFVLYKHPRMKVGLWVDDVSKVYQVREDMIPVTDGHHNIRGTVKIDDDEYPLLDLNVLFQ